MVLYSVSRALVIQYFFDKYLIIVSKIFSQAIETHFLKFNASIIF